MLHQKRPRTDDHREPNPLNHSVSTSSSTQLHRTSQASRGSDVEQGVKQTRRSSSSQTSPLREVSESGLYRDAKVQSKAALPQRRKEDSERRAVTAGSSTIRIYIASMRELEEERYDIRPDTKVSEFVRRVNERQHGEGSRRQSLLEGVNKPPRENVVFALRAPDSTFDDISGRSDRTLRLYRSFARGPNEEYCLMECRSEERRVGKECRL